MSVESNIRCSSHRNTTLTWSKHEKAPVVGVVPPHLYIPQELMKKTITHPDKFLKKKFTKNQSECLEKVLEDPVEKNLSDLHIKTTIDFFESIDEYIVAHIEKRIQTMFTTILVVGNSKLTYSLHDTDLQIGSGHLRNSKKPKGTSEHIKERSQYVAAHISTIPSLKYELDGTEYVMGKGSRLELLMNATDLLPKEVNEVDSLIDGKNSAKKANLRTTSLKILNEASNEGLNAIDALIEFVESLKKYITAAKARLNNSDLDLNDVNDKKIYVLERYEEIVDEYLESLSGDESEVEEFIKKILFLQNDSIKVELENEASRILDKLSKKTSKKTSKNAPNEDSIKVKELREFFISLKIYISVITEHLENPIFDHKIKKKPKKDVERINVLKSLEASVDDNLQHLADKETISGDKLKFQESIQEIFDTLDDHHEDTRSEFYSFLYEGYLLAYYASKKNVSGQIIEDPVAIPRRSGRKRIEIIPSVKERLSKTGKDYKEYCLTIKKIQNLAQKVLDDEENQVIKDAFIKAVKDKITKDYGVTCVKNIGLICNHILFAVKYPINIPKPAEKLSNRAEVYKDYCIALNRIQKLAKKCIKKHSTSEPSQELEEAVKDEITSNKKFDVKQPRNITNICKHILFEITYSELTK
ncbi:MAG: hypothetical protein H0W88_11670 [Parachlamydiaceae bacterium]|nr:hypothetical protein [Parachlamydiaceae bacterium]